MESSTKELVKFMEVNKITELSTVQEVGHYNVYVTIQEKVEEDEEYE